MARLLLCFKPMTRDREERDVPSSRPSRPYGSQQQLPPAQNSSDGSRSQEAQRNVVAFVELLKRRNEPLGLVLNGGADCSQPVHVGQLYPGGVAEKSGTVMLGDRIHCINGTATEHLNQSEANALLNNSGNVINLEIEFETDGPGVDLGNTVKKVAVVKLRRGDRNSFGFTISGGRTEGRPITVSNVAVGSMAFKAGILKAGDRILKINWLDMSRASQMEALTILKSSEDMCTLEIEYDVTLHEGLNEYRGQLLVELLKPKGVTLGITLQEDPNAPGAPLIVSQVKEAGIAARCGALHPGDRLLSLNKELLAGKSVEDVRHLLKYADLSLELEIIPGHNFPPLVNESPNGSPPPRHCLSSAASHLSGLDTRSFLSLSSAPTTHIVTTHPETMVVRLQMDSIGYGMSLQGGFTERGGVMPIVIASIEDGGPAAKLGQLQVGDQILSIDGIKISGYSLQEAMKLVREAESAIKLEIMFEVQDTRPPSSGSFEVHVKKRTASLNLGITINGNATRGDPIWISSLRKGGIAYRGGMLQSGDRICAINGQTLENSNLRDAERILINAGENITLRISKETPTLPSSPSPTSSETIIYSVELHRNQQSLGITLKGNREQACHPIIISRIKEDGVAHKTGTLKVGDRILAINGESLYNKTMPEAVSMLNRAGDVVNLKISKATRRHKSRHKSSSPTGRQRAGGRLNRELVEPYGALAGGGGYHLPPHPHHYHMHRQSFGGSSSGSSFVNGYSGGGRGMPRAYNYPRPSRYRASPMLGESASGYNTPESSSLVSSFPPVAPPSHAPGMYAAAQPGERRVNARMMDYASPGSEVGGYTSMHMGPGGGGAQMGSVASGLPPYHANQWPVMSQPPTLDDDQISSVSSQRRPYYPFTHLDSSRLASEQLQHLPRQRKPSLGIVMGGATKRDSSTDDEMSAYDLEGRSSAAKFRRSSLPGGKPSQYSTQYSSGREPRGGAKWEFKSPKAKLVGRVSPITPTETDRMAVVPSMMQQIKSTRITSGEEVEGGEGSTAKTTTHLPPSIQQQQLQMVPPALEDDSGKCTPLAQAPALIVSTTEVLPGSNEPQEASNSRTVNEGEEGVDEGNESANEAGEGEEEEEEEVVVEELPHVSKEIQTYDEGLALATDHSEGESMTELNDVPLPPPSPPHLGDDNKAPADSPSPSREPSEIDTGETNSVTLEQDTDATISSTNALNDTTRHNTKLQNTESSGLVNAHSKLDEASSDHVFSPPSPLPTPPSPFRYDDQSELATDDYHHRLTPPLPPPPPSSSPPALPESSTTKTPSPPLSVSHHREDLSDFSPRNTAKRNITDHNRHSPTHLQMHPYHQQQPSSHSNSPLSYSLPRHSKTSTASSEHSYSKQATSDDYLFLRKATAVSNPERAYSKQHSNEYAAILQKATPLPHPQTANSSNASTNGKTLQPLVPSLPDFRRTMDNADKYQKAIEHLAESGSSDQDSDSEPHAKHTALPPQEQARVKEKMKASQSTVRHSVKIYKQAGEMSYGFSISDGQFDRGVYVKTVKPGGPSDRGGLLPYDKIVKVNDTTLQAEHKSINVYPLLKKYENELNLVICRQSKASSKGANAGDSSPPVSLTPPLKELPPSPAKLGEVAPSLQPRLVLASQDQKPR